MSSCGTCGTSSPSPRSCTSRAPRERLHIAQQPLSAAIARLEQQLGATLLERTTRRVELTEAGTALLEPARAALRAATTRSLPPAPSAARRGRRGRRSASPPAPGTGSASCSTRCGSGTRRLRLHVRQQSTRPLLDDVRAGTLDLAVGPLRARSGRPRGTAAQGRAGVLVVAGGAPARRAGPRPTLQRVRDETVRARRSRRRPRLQRRGGRPLRPRGLHARHAASATHHDAWERAIAERRLRRPDNALLRPCDASGGSRDPRRPARDLPARPALAAFAKVRRAAGRSTRYRRRARYRASAPLGR